jgi:hypothetical protein
MANYELHVDTDANQQVTRFKLSNTTTGQHLASHEVVLPEHSTALWEGVFDTRRYIERYDHAMIFDGQTEPATAEMLLQRLGDFLGEHVLGAAITRELTRRGQHALVVRLPTTDEDVLAAAFARVPWEIARLPDGTRLRNIVVRAVTADTDPGPAPVTEAAQRMAAGETLRILAVFAEAPGSRPLAMRLEREQLRKLFATQILPHRNVELDILCHGVTRQRLREAIRTRHGYHIVHWSGHGHHNMLELQGEPGNCIIGERLVDLFDEAGGFIPQLFVLSACHSGSLLRVKDWQSLQAALERETGDAPEEATKAIAESKQLNDAYQNPSGYTGTALALLKAGVPQVVAMRYAVGDEYARELGCAFYRRLLADPDPLSADDALALARRDVLDDPEQTAYHVVDHATPLMFGQTGRVLEPQRMRSRQMNRLSPQPQPLLSGGRTDLDPPAVFVGRDEPLSRLGREWLGEGGPAVALIQGLAGLGKTSLAAEAIHLWHERFDYVLAFQARPTALQLDDMCYQLNQKLMLESQRYRDKCNQNTYKRIYLEHDARMFPSPEQRYDRMRQNLIEALHDEAILLVLNNLESNLERVETAEGSSVYACADPAWDALLAALARQLPETPRSRLLVTARHRPRALADATTTLWLPLGPLPMGEAGLYLRTRPELRRLLFGDDASGRALVYRLLHISRGHPLILDRFSNLASDPVALSAVLDRIQSDGWQGLPDLFDEGVRDDAQRERERQYLEEVVIGAVDLLIERLSPPARRLLGVITLANEPVSEAFIAGVWQGRSVEDEQLELIGQWLPLLLDHAPNDDPHKQRAVALLETNEGQQLLEQLRNLPPPSDASPVGPLLAELHGAGLLSQYVPAPSGAEGSATLAAGGQGTDGSATYGFHELVRERVAVWMVAYADQRDPRPDDEIRVAYGERYAQLFHILYHQNRDAANEVGRRALVYFVAARAFERLGSFASQLITGVADPALLRSVVAELEGAIEQAPPGQMRWHLRTYVADALCRAGQPDQALSLYATAAAEAEAAPDWSGVAWITGQWAKAALDVGDLEAAKPLRLRSTRAQRQAGDPAVTVVGSELEALRIDVLRGEAEQVLPDIDSRLKQVRQWWQRDQAGELVSEAPNRTVLGRVMVGALAIAGEANRCLERWQAELNLLEEIESVQRALRESDVELARSHSRQSEPLMELGWLDDAQRVLENCLLIFRSAGLAAEEARCLSMLANVWNKRNEPSEAIALARQALAVFNTLPDPANRAVSHGSLSIYLTNAGQHAEATVHCLAAGAYVVGIGRGDYLVTWRQNLGIHARRALANGTRYTLPRLDDVLAQPASDTLRQFLESHGIDRAALQAEIDWIVDQAHELTAAHAQLAQLESPIITAAAEGQDVEPMLAELRQQLVEQAGEDMEAAQIDDFVDDLRRRLDRVRTSDNASP